MKCLRSRIKRSPFPEFSFQKGMYMRGINKWKRIAALVFIFGLLLPQSPMFSEPVVSVMAATPEDTNLIAPEKEEGEISNGDHTLSRYTFYNNTFTLTNTYHHESGPLMTYRTVDMVWSKNSTKETGRKLGYPLLSGTEGTDWVRSGVGARDSMVSEGFSEAEYVFEQSTLKQILRQLYGELEADKEYKIYMSSIFVLKQRYADGSYKLYSKEYTNLDDIRAAASWTETTYEQFEAYYDIPMTFKL